MKVQTPSRFENIEQKADDKNNDDNNDNEDADVTLITKSRARTSFILLFCFFCKNGYQRKRYLNMTISRMYHEIIPASLQLA